MKGEDEFTKEYDDRLREAWEESTEDYFEKRFENEEASLIVKFFPLLGGVIILINAAHGLGNWLLPLSFLPLAIGGLYVLVRIKRSYSKKFRDTYRFALMMSSATTFLLLGISILEIIY